MAVAEVLDPQPGEWVLDLAAAPGGKATHIASLMQDQGLLVANEFDGKRSKALLQNLERWGVQNTIVTNEDIARLANHWGAIFDRVLLDAPCSGEGMFRKSDEALCMWSEENVRHCALRQERLLAQAAKLVKPGGVLVYSTCTFAPEENEAVIANFLAQYPDYSLELINIPDARPGQASFLPATQSATQSAIQSAIQRNSEQELHKTVRLWPHLLKGEGHFIARLKRNAVQGCPVKQHQFAAVPSQSRSLFQQFFSKLKMCSLSERRLAMFRDQLYSVPEKCPDLGALRISRPGLWLGTVRKNRFEPSHSLALAVSSVGQDIPHIDLCLDDPDLSRYLLGDILERSGADGWLLVTVQGFSLGWAKRSQNVVKNAYPKGLRMLQR